MISGVSTPKVARAARPGVTLRQRNWPRFSQPPRPTSAARNDWLARSSASYRRAVRRAEVRSRDADTAGAALDPQAVSTGR